MYRSLPDWDWRAGLYSKASPGKCPGGRRDISWKRVWNALKRKERLYQAAKKGEETPGYDKQFILLEYLFNIDKGQAENLTKKYAQDLPNLENSQENDELKQIISQIQTILNCNDERSDTRTF